MTRHGGTRRWSVRPRSRAWPRALPWLALAGIGALLSGCGPQYVLLHPAGRVGRSELHLMLLAAITMGVVIVFVFVLQAIAAIAFRDTERRRAPYTPEWHGSRRLEVLWFVIPTLMLTVIAVPTVRQTYALARLPQKQDPLVIDVTSLTWKWLFEYPSQQVATVNYLVIPTGKPVLFKLTADSAMNTFWVPQLGGMEYTMPGEVLPLWLQSDTPGTYWGHSDQFSGTEFEKMFFTVKAVPPAQFAAWATQVHGAAPPMTMRDYRRLLVFGTVGQESYSAYPAQTFPAAANGFTLVGGRYIPAVAGAQGSAHLSMGAGAGTQAPPA